MKSTFCYAVMLCVVALGAARAQTVEIGGLGGYPRWGRAPLGSISFELPGETDTRLKGQYSYGGTFTVNTKGYYGFELGYIRSLTELKTTVHQTSGNDVFDTLFRDRLPVHIGYLNAVVYFMPRGERWRPYVTGGGQAYQYQTPRIAQTAVGASWPPGNLRHYGVNFGFGLKLRLFSHALIRWEIRDFIGGKPYNTSFPNTSLQLTGHIHLIQGMMGAAITF